MEIAYISANKLHIEIEKKEEGSVSKLLERITRKPSKFITTMLLGNNVALVIYGLYMGELLMMVLTPDQPPQNAFINYWLTGSGLLITQTIISTFIILFTAEFLPKVFFQLYANSLLKIFAIPAYAFYAVFNFLSTFVMWISDTILKLFFKTEGDEVQEAFTKVELGNYIEEQIETVTQEDVDSEVLIFKNALKFSEIKMREVMIPRTEVIATDSSESLENIRHKFTETGLSKILVYKDSIDDIIGYIHSFALFKKPNSIKSILIPVIYVPETMLAKDILNALIKKGQTIAVVIDEYGGTSGIATVEDIVEELFGEIEDEHDAALLVEKDLGNNHYKFSGRTEIDYINDTYKLDLPKSELYETLGGLIMQHTEEIPHLGSIIESEGYRFKVLEASNTKIKLVEIQDLNPGNN